MLTLTRARYLLVIVMGFLVIENKWKLDIFRIQITFFGGVYSRYFLQTVHDVRHKIVLVPYSLLGKIFFFLKPPKGGPA